MKVLVVEELRDLLVAMRRDVVLNEKVAFKGWSSVLEKVGFERSASVDEEAALAPTEREDVALTRDVVLDEDEGATVGKNVALDEDVGSERAVMLAVMLYPDAGAASQPSWPRTLRKRTSFNMTAYWKW